MTERNLDEQLAKLRIEREQKRPGRGGRWWKWGLLALVAGGAAFAVYSHLNAAVAVKTARIDQDTPDPRKGPPLLTASGYVIPRHKVEVSSKIIARIEEVLIQRGDRVKEGDVLIRLDDGEYQARVRSAEAQVRALQARVAELKTGSRPQEIEAADAAVASAEATLESSELDYARIEALSRQGAVSRQELDRARAARDVARARLDADRKNAELVRIGPRAEQVALAEAQLHEAEANLEFAKTELTYTVIRAPISGVILEKLAEQGELVTNMNFGGTRGAKNSVVTMADLNDLLVEVDVNESELSKVTAGQHAEIHLDSNPERVYAGEVDEIAPQADRQKGTVQVKVRIADPDDAIRTEVNARVTFLGQPAAAGAANRPRLWIPKGALAPGKEEPVVYVIEDGKAVAKPVVLGIESERGMEVAEGLTGNEVLILSPLEKIADGTRVVAAS